MTYRGGGRGGRRYRHGEHCRTPYRQGRGTGGGRASGFVWPPPASTPRAVQAQYHGHVAPVVYGAPMAPRPAGFGHVPTPLYRVTTPPAPQIVYAPPPAPLPVVIRAPTPAPLSSAPVAVTVQAPPPAPTPAPASSAPSAAALAKEVFVSETALAPAAAVATTQEGKAAAAEDAPDVDLAPVSKKGPAHPARPGFGTLGKKVMVRANHFLVDVADNKLFHYDVSINPESKSRQTNREVLNELIRLHGKTSLGGKLPAYDGRKSLYTAGPLPFDAEEFAVTLVAPNKKDKERAEREYKITIRIVGKTDMYRLTQFLRGRQRDMPQETIQVLNVVLTESPSWNYVTVVRSFFSTSFGHRGDIGEGLECWRGYCQSLRPTQMGLSLNIDISATSFFKPVTVIKFVEEFLNIRDMPRPLSDRDRVKIKKALQGVSIETSHNQEQIRRSKITGITPIPMSQLIFPVDEEGMKKTVVQYFWDKYNYGLKYVSWPCLQAGSDCRPVFLPMEVCRIVEGQRYSKKLNDNQVTNILRATCKRPQEREQSIRDLILYKNHAEDKFAQEFGIQACNDLVSVPARVLPPPLLKYHDSGRVKVCAPSVGQWNMINKKMITGGTVDNWTCLNFSQMRPEEVQRFSMDLIYMCNATGMAVNPVPCIEVRSAAPSHIDSALRDVYWRALQIRAKHGTGNQLQLLIVILPDDGGSYGKIKRVCETDIGVVSQCCLPRHASRPNKQYLENVALKINAKVGGRNTVLERAFVRNGIPFVSEKSAIIFGADMTQPTPEEDSASSTAAVGGRNTVLDRAFVRNGIPFVSEKSAIIFGADMTQPTPEEDSASSTAAVVASVDCHWPEVAKSRGIVSAQSHTQERVEDLFTVSKDPEKGHMVGQLDTRIITVDLLSHDVYVAIDKMATVDHIFAKAAEKLNVHLTDVFFTCDGRIAPPDQIIDSACILRTRHRVRGGSKSQPIKLLDLYNNLLHQNRWFEKIWIHSSLRNKKMKAYAVGAAESATHILAKLVECLERRHRQGNSYDGNFSIDDIWYYPDRDSIEIEVQEYLVPINQRSYIEDQKAVKVIIDALYTYQEKDGSLEYVIYVGDLVNRITMLQLSGSEYSSTIQRSIIFLHPAGKSFWMRIQSIKLLRLFPTKEKSVYASLFCMALRCHFFWIKEVNYKNAPAEMAKVYRHFDQNSNHSNKNRNVRVKAQNKYKATYLSWLDYARCLVTHASKGRSVKEIDAAIALMWANALPNVQQLLIKRYGHLATGLPVAGSGISGGPQMSASGIGSSSRGSQMPAYASATSSRGPRMPCSAIHSSSRGSQMSSSIATSSSGPQISGSGIASSSSGPISVTQITSNNDPELHQIFGFYEKPPN